MLCICFPPLPLCPSVFLCLAVSLPIHLYTRLPPNRPSYLSVCFSLYPAVSLPPYRAPWIPPLPPCPPAFSTSPPVCLPVSLVYRSTRLPGAPQRNKQAIVRIKYLSSEVILLCPFVWLNATRRNEWCALWDPDCNDVSQ